MSKIVLLAFTLCNTQFGLGSLPLIKRDHPSQALCLDDAVTIETVDNIRFEVEVRYAQLSQTLSNLIKDAGIENPLPLQCSSYTWSMIQCLLSKLLKVILDSKAQEEIIIEIP